MGINPVTRKWVSRLDAISPTSTVSVQPPKDKSGRAPIETVISQLLSPAVDLEEAREYDSYVHQFSHLSLSLSDLTSKDADLYLSTVAIAGGGGESSLTVDRASQAVYAEVVKVSRGR